jgi:hypothetical protein
LKVADLKVGELYKIRSDRKTHVHISYSGRLDIHVESKHFAEKSKIRPFDHMIYLGKDSGNWRWVNYRGKKLRVYPNIWQHIVPIDEDIS